MLYTKLWCAFTLVTSTQAGSSFSMPIAPIRAPEPSLRNYKPFATMMIEQNRLRLLALAFGETVHPVKGRKSLFEHECDDFSFEILIMCYFFSSDLGQDFDELVKKRQAGIEARLKFEQHTILVLARNWLQLKQKIEVFSK